MLRLENKVAIVTGGGRGIGRTLSHRMAEEGAKVVVADILGKETQETAGEIVAVGGEAFALKVDVSSEEDTQHMASEAIKVFGRIDVLVNNAALFYGLTSKPFMELPIDEWKNVMEVNVTGVFLCCRAVFPQMKKQASGKIINIASNSALVGSPNLSHYVTSKGAVIAFTRCLATELAQYGIRANSVAPGVVVTESTENLPQLKETVLAATPLGCLASPDNVAGTVIFFASDESNHITGQTLIVDGGRRMH